MPGKPNAEALRALNEGLLTAPEDLADLLPDLGILEASGRAVKLGVQEPGGDQAPISVGAQLVRRRSDSASSTISFIAAEVSEVQGAVERSAAARRRRPDQERATRAASAAPR